MGEFKLPPPIAVDAGLARMYERRFERLKLTDAAAVRSSQARAAAASKGILETHVVEVPVAAGSSSLLFEAGNSNGGVSNGGAGGGFAVAEDVAGKPGLIAETPGASIALALGGIAGVAAAGVFTAETARPALKGKLQTHPGSSADKAGPYLVLVLGYLTSYEKMGAFYASVAACPEPAEGGVEGTGTSKTGKSGCVEVIPKTRVKGLKPSENVSVFTTTVLSGALPPDTRLGASMRGAAMHCLVLALSVAANEPGGGVRDGTAGGKVKLYEASWTWVEEDPKQDPG